MDDVAALFRTWVGVGGEPGKGWEFGTGGFFAVPLTKWRIPNGGVVLKIRGINGGRGLDGKTLTGPASEKWVYTKLTLSAVSAQLKEMLHMQSDSVQHNESGHSRVVKDGDVVEKVRAAIETDIFVPDTQQLINISTGKCTSPWYPKICTTSRESSVLRLCRMHLVVTQQKRLSISSTLSTLRTKRKKSSNKKAPLSGRSEEVTAL